MTLSRFPLIKRLGTGSMRNTCRIRRYAAAFLAVAKARQNRRSLRAASQRLLASNSHRHFPTLLLLLLLSAGAPVVQSETYAGDDTAVTITAPYLDVHTGPGRGYPVFHVVEKSETIQLIKRRTGWYKIATVDGKTGWVRRADLQGALGADGMRLDVSTQGWQGYNDKHWELGLLGGDFSGARSTTLNLSLRMTEHLSTELKYTQAFGNFSDSKLASLNIVHRPFPEWRLAPFFLLGAGAVKTSPSATLVETEDRQDNALTVGAGLMLYLSQRFAVRAEYNKHTLLTTRENNEEVDEWKAGFSVSF